MWLFQFLLLPRLLWPLTIYEIGLPTVEGLEKKHLDEHLTNTYSDDLRHIPLQVRRDIPVVPLPASMFSLASPSPEEVRRAIRKARNRSAPGPNGDTMDPINRYIRSWLGLPPGMSSVALYSKSAKLMLPLRSIVEEYKVSKIRTQWMLNNSADIRIREVKPLLKTKMKFKAQDEINKSVSELTFEEMRGPIQTGRHAVGWNHFAKWSESCSAIRAELIIRERRREIERERVTKAVQQSQQGRWTTWEDMVQRSISWNEIWKMSLYRLTFVIRSIYDQLPSRDNLRRWGLTEDCKCELCGESETLHHVISNCKYAIDNGRYTWQHNKVLNEVVEAIKMAVARANSRKNILQRKVYFLREGFSLPCKKHKLPSRRDILSEANDCLGIAAGGRMLFSHRRRQMLSFW